MKAAYIPLGAAGHILASLPMIGALASRGVQVTYFAPEAFRAEVEASGARFVPMPAVAAKGSVSGGKDFLAGVPLTFLTEAAGVIGAIMPTLERDRPDAIIADQLGLAGRLAASHLALPLVMAFTSYAPCEAFSVFRTWPEYPDTHPARAEALRLAEQLARQYGGPLLTPREIFEGTAAFNVSMLSRLLQPAGERFGEDFYFAGAQIAGRAQDGAWTPPQDDKPLLYTSLGSLFNNWPGFYRMLFPIARGLDAHVVCAVGRSVLKEDIGPVPSNVTLLPFAPQLRILQRAGGFITHAGAGSSMEALYYGVPCACIPQMDEQRMTAGRLKELGLSCATLERDALTEDALGKAIKTLLYSEALHERARQLSLRMHEEGGAQGAAEAVIRFIIREKYDIPASDKRSERP